MVHRAVVVTGVAEISGVYKERGIELDSGATGEHYLLVI